MKTNKLLIPTISTVGIATISLASCSTPTADTYVAIPTQYLNIVDNVLNGFKNSSVNLNGYSKLTITSNITNVKGFNYTGVTQKAFNAITKIDFEERKETTVIAANAFSALAELKVLVFPSDCRRITLNTNSFLSCQKLDTLDFSKVTKGFAAEFDTLKWAYTIADKGTIYANTSNKLEVEAIRTILDLDSTNWPIVVK